MLTNLYALLSLAVTFMVLGLGTFREATDLPGWSRMAVIAVLILAGLALYRTGHGRRRT